MFIKNGSTKSVSTVLQPYLPVLNDIQSTIIFSLPPSIITHAHTRCPFHFLSLFSMLLPAASNTSSARIITDSQNTKAKGQDKTKTNLQKHCLAYSKALPSVAFPHRGVPAAPAVALVRKAPSARAGLAAGEDDDVSVLRRAARWWDAVVGVTDLLGSRSHQSVYRYTVFALTQERGSE
jgi:hypothetical protein